MTKQETKQQSESLWNKYFDEKLQGVMGVPFAKRKAKEYSILEVQSKIDLLEEMKQKVYARISFFNNELNQQKEILKYLEEL